MCTDVPMYIYKHRIYKHSHSTCYVQISSTQPPPFPNLTFSRFAHEEVLTLFQINVTKSGYIKLNIVIEITGCLKSKVNRIMNPREKPTVKTQARIVYVQFVMHHTSENIAHHPHLSLSHVLCSTIPIFSVKFNGIF